VLKWVFERCDKKTKAKETAIGLLPTVEALDTNGLQIKPETLHKLLDVDVEAWKAEIGSIREHFAKFGDKMPHGLIDELNDLEKRLNS